MPKDKFKAGDKVYVVGNVATVIRRLPKSKRTHAGITDKQYIIMFEREDSAQVIFPNNKKATISLLPVRESVILPWSPVVYTTAEEGHTVFVHNHELHMCTSRHGEFVLRKEWLEHHYHQRDHWGASVRLFYLPESNAVSLNMTDIEHLYRLCRLAEEGDGEGENDAV